MCNHGLPEGECSMCQADAKLAEVREPDEEEHGCSRCASPIAKTTEYPNDLHPKGEPQRLCYLCAETLWPGGAEDDVVAVINRNTHYILAAIRQDQLDGGRA